MAIALVLAACAGPTVSATPAASAAPQRTATPTPMPTQNIFGMLDMMGGAPPATVFALAGGRVRAVRLLDHFVKYEIALGRGAQLIVSADATRLYVADQPDSAAVPGVRLRAFDVATGAERAAATGDGVPSMLVGGAGSGALALDPRGRLLVLRGDGGSAWVDAYDGASLRLDERRLLEAPPCADRLVTTDLRVAAVCLRDATAAIRVGSGTVTRRLAPRALAGVVATQDASIVAVTTDGELFRLAPGSAEAVAISAEEGRADVPLDGLAATEGLLVLARGGAAPAVRVVSGGGFLPPGGRVFAIPVAPSRGILAWWPFAYFTSGGALYHVDLRSGTVERMAAGFEDDAVAAAIAPR